MRRSFAVAFRSVLGDLVTILWTIDNSFARVAESVGGNRIEFVRVHPREFIPAVVPALGRGGVVAVVADAACEELALSLGVDETLLATQVEEDALASLIARARVRANARELRERSMADQATHDGTAHMMLLGAAIAHEMNNPLAVASLNTEVLHMSVRSLLELLEEVKSYADAGTPMPLAVLRRLCAARKLSPAREDIAAALQDLQMALRDAAMMVVRMTALTDTQPAGETVDLGVLLSEFASLVRAEVERVSRFNVQLPSSGCFVEIPKGWAMQIVASLVANSLEAVADLPHRKAEIELRLTLHEEVCVIEVRDNGTGMSADVRRRAVEPFFTTRRPGALGLGLTMVIAQARRVGGEVLTDSRPGVGTTIRVFLPTVRKVDERVGNPRLAN
ncbi:MAG TPA: sensor histidine kinase [Polyangiaceae bacterium]|nr:sensor histidine kinase [Polyangiaceae bacterium]